jgi:hypothetical protein
MQLALIEPTGREAALIAAAHLQRAEKHARMASIWETRGASTLAKVAKRSEAIELAQVEAMCDLAQLEELAGLL